MLWDNHRAYGYIGINGLSQKRSVCDINSSVWEAGVVPQTDEAASQLEDPSVICPSGAPSPSGTRWALLKYHDHLACFVLFPSSQHHLKDRAVVVQDLEETYPRNPRTAHLFACAYQSSNKVEVSSDNSDNSEYRNYILPYRQDTDFPRDRTPPL